MKWVPKRSDTPERLVVSLTGDPLERGQSIAILSWLMAALRHSRSSGVALSEVSFTRVPVSTPDIFYGVKLKYLTRTQSGSLGTCWYALFKKTVIVSANLSLDSKRNGLHIDLQRLLHISGATIPWKSKVVYFYLATHPKGCRTFLSQWRNRLTAHFFGT